MPLKDVFLLSGESDLGITKKTKHELISGLNESNEPLLNVLINTPQNKLTDEDGNVIEHRPISLMEAIEGSLEDRALIPHLKRRIWSEYLAYHSKDNRLDTLSKREKRKKVFEPFLTVLDRKIDSLSRAQLEKDVVSRKTQRRLDFFAALRDPEIGIQAATGKYGYVWWYELKADGSTDNPQGWSELEETIEWGLTNDYLQGNEVLDWIHQDFIPRGVQPKKGEKTKTTTLQKLKPNTYNRLKALALKARSGELQRKEIEIKSNIDSKLRSVISDAAKEKEKNPSYTIDRSLLNDRMYQTAKELGISVNHVGFNQWKNVMTREETKHLDAIAELDRQYASGGLMDNTLLDLLNPQADYNNNQIADKEEYTAKVDERGGFGMTSAQRTTAKGEIEKVVAPMFKVTSSLDIGKVEQGWVEDRALADLDVIFGQLQLKSDLQGKSAKEQRRIINNNFNTAKAQVLENIKARKYHGPTAINPQGENFGQAYEARTVLFNNLKNESGGTLKLADILNHPKYWDMKSDGTSHGQEHAAIVEYLKTGEVPDYYKKINANSTIFNSVPLKKIVAARAAATTGMRNDKNEIIPQPPTVEGSGLSEQQVDKMSTKPNAAKSYQTISTQPQAIAWMLNNLQDPYALDTDLDPNNGLSGQGYDTVRRYKTDSYSSTDVNIGTDTPITQLPLSYILNLKDGDLRFGMYGISIDDVLDLAESTDLDLTQPLSKEMQEAIVLSRWQDLAQEQGGLGMLNQTTRRAIKLHPKKREDLKNILKSKPGLEFLTTPSNDLNCLSEACAKLVVDMATQ